MASVNSYRVTVKTANGSAGDLTVNCPIQWCVFDIKTLLLEQHPLHPPVREQKLIYSGAFLQHETLLKDVFGKNNSVYVHLVVSPATNRSNSVPAPRTPLQTIDERPHLPPATVNSSSHNAQLPRNVTTTPLATSSTTPPTPHVTHGRNITIQFRTNPPPTSEGLRNRSQMYTFGQQPITTSPFPAHQMMWSNPYMFSPYYNAQFAQWYQASLQQQGAGHPQANQNSTNVTNDGLLLDNQPGAGDAGAPAGVRREGDQQDLELPDDLDAAGAGGAAGGFALMAENRRRRDIVDYAYMLLMMTFLGAIGYLTGSFYQFLIFFAGVGVIMLNQGGWFTLQRRQVRENQVENEPVPAPVPPVREDGPHGNQPLEPAGERAETNNQRAESNDQGAESNNESTNQTEDQVAADPIPNNAHQRPGIITTVVMFVTSFFSSLLPQQIPELQAN